MVIPFMIGFICGIITMCGAIAFTLWLFPTLQYPKIIENPYESLIKYYKSEIEKLTNEKSS